ncbi:MAG: metalloregulator ArsR/SmtB family transcription factor [Pseudomonadaceae bacterium]|nr:metalloregulator ArsR/SmtB family transcription factor [Pseudomonadaceae bacterium]
MDLNNAVDTLSALAHEGRLTLVRSLIQAGPDGINAGELATLAGVGATTASAQLLVLKNAGLVQSERRGRQIIYSANYEKMAGLLGFLMEDCCCSHPQICQPLQDALK